MFPLAPFSRLIARIVLTVMLATVFAPSFGWEALEATMGHELAASQPETMADDCHEHHGPAASQPEEARAAGDLDHHCCPGHVLGHLLGGTSGNALRVPPAECRFAVDASCGAFSSRVPEGLERPPRLAA